MGYEFELNDAIARIHPIPAQSAGGRGRGADLALEIDGALLRAALRPGREAGAFTLEIDGIEEPIWIAAQGDTRFIQLRGRVHRVQVVNAVDRARREAAPTRGEALLLAPMPGVVVEVVVEAGAQVEAGQLLMTIESMKLQTPIVAPEAGRVETVFVSSGAAFDQGAALVQLFRGDAVEDAEETTGATDGDGDRDGDGTDTAGRTQTTRGDAR